MDTMPTNPEYDLKNGKAQPADLFLWRILKEAHPKNYETRLATGIRGGVFDADRAIAFPLTRNLEKRLVSLPHAHELAPDLNRDQRLVAWFEACSRLGAKPLPALVRLGEHASGGFARLIQMKAFQTLAWWKAVGAEERFHGPHGLGGEPTTFATLAFIHGFPEAIKPLLEGSRLTHTDKLWTLIWHRRCVGQSDQLLRFLSPLGGPPKHALVGLACSALNKKNITRALKTAQALVDEGCDPNASFPGALPPLAGVLAHFQSPSCTPMVEFLLVKGADPMAKVGPPLLGVCIADPNQTIVEFALDLWLRCSPQDNLRRALGDCFEMMARRCNQQALLKLFPPARQEEISRKLGGLRASPTPFGKVVDFDPSPEVAKLQSLWLDLSSPKSQSRSSARLRI